jgi:hypothetical protein
LARFGHVKYIFHHIRGKDIGSPGFAAIVPPVFGGVKGAGFGGASTPQIRVSTTEIPKEPKHYQYFTSNFVIY